MIIALFILGIGSRLVPHLPNFVPIIAIALFSGAYLNKKHSLWVPITLYVVSEFILGLHDIFLFTSLSVLAISILGRILRKRRGMAVNLVYSLFSAVLFFVVTNFGVWLVGWYPPTLEGLIQCYVNGIPFFRASIVSNLVYMFILTSVFNLVTAKVENKKFKFALLTN